MNYTISAVSAETGIAKEVLRKWESRYGFPTPSRDMSGDRAYSTNQVNKLKLIKRLLDDGMRPNQVVALEENQLLALISRASVNMNAADACEQGIELLGWLKVRDPEQLRDNLRAVLDRDGLKDFVMNVMPVMNRQVGQAWGNGEIAIRDEHLYTEILTGLVRAALSRTVVTDAFPRVLITTPPGELHTLGILMVEAVLSSHGAHCISLGPQSPLSEILLAAADYAVQVVALSISESFPKRRVVPLLRELRSQLPSAIQLWAGGAGTIGIEKVPRGTLILHSLEDAVRQVQKVQSRT